MPVAHINNTDIYYETYGDGFPLIYSHGGFGGLGTGARFEPPSWVPEFAEHFKVILYDRRSAGRSAFPRVPHTMELFASDARELLRHLGHNKAHKWGTSGGGPITMEFGFQYPDVAQSLVIHETSPKFWDEEDENDRRELARLWERIQVMEREGEEAAYEARRAGGTVGLQTFRDSRPVITSDDVESRTTRRASITAQLNSVPREERISKYAGELRNYAAFAAWSGRERIRELKMPVLIPYSHDDTMLPNARWDQLTVGMPNVTYIPVLGVDHGGTMGVPGIKDQILEFLLKNTPESSQPGRPEGQPASRRSS